MLLRPLLLLIAACATSANAWYLPGAAPVSYASGQSVPLLVNSLGPSSGRTGETDVLLYDAYDPRLGFCAPSTPSSVPLSLGSALFGDRLHPSLFQLHMLRNTTCRLLCRTTLSPKQQRFTTDLVWSAYSHNWLVDGLPVAQRIAARAWARNGTEQEVYYEPGFPVGLPSVRHSPLLAGALEEDGDGGVKADELARLVLLNNHFTLVLEYHRPRGKEDVYRVVGATVAPRSVDSLGAGAGGGAEAPDCAATQGALELEADRAESREVAYTYDVVWKESPISWATRWDIYLDFQHPRIHLLSLINSLFICVFLILMVSVILLRVLNRDITRYNALASYDLDLDPDADGGLSGGGGGGVQEDYGWKLLHGEIFRPPKQRMWLCITVGTGAQMAAMCLVTLFFALLGFLSPSNRGALATVMLVCWTLFGSIAGYVSSRLYLTLNGDAIRKNIIYTAMVFPSVLFAFLHLLNLFLIGVGSAGAVPFGTFAAIVLLWFGINVPLTIVGGWVGVKKGPLAAPSRVNSIPRQIPPVEWWVRPVPAALLAGILPFGAGFIELYYILQSIFGAKAYYAFGFLALSTGVVALTTALTSVLMCYFHLCAEDYRWHWRAFLTGASSGLYLFLYGLLFWASRLHLSGFANKVLYLGYLALLAALEGIVMGSVGFAACWVFVRVIYSRIRVD